MEAGREILFPAGDGEGRRVHDFGQPSWMNSQRVHGFPAAEPRQRSCLRGGRLPVPALGPEGEFGERDYAGDWGLAPRRCGKEKTGGDPKKGLKIDRLARKEHFGPARSPTPDGSRESCAEQPAGIAENREFLDQAKDSDRPNSRFTLPYPPDCLTVRQPIPDSATLTNPSRDRGRDWDRSLPLSGTTAVSRTDSARKDLSCRVEGGGT